MYRLSLSWCLCAEVWKGEIASGGKIQQVGSRAQCSAPASSFTLSILPSAGGGSWLFGFPLLPSSKIPGTNTDMCKTQSTTKKRKKALLCNCFSPEHPFQQLSPLPRALCTPPLLPARRTLSLQMAIVCFVVADVWSNLERGEKKNLQPFLL